MVPPACLSWRANHQGLVFQRQLFIIAPLIAFKRKSYDCMRPFMLALANKSECNISMTSLINNDLRLYQLKRKHIYTYLFNLINLLNVLRFFKWILVSTRYHAILFNDLLNGLLANGRES